LGGGAVAPFAPPPCGDANASSGSAMKNIFPRSLRWYVFANL